MSAGDGAPRAFLDGKVVLHGGDSRELVKGLAPNCLDAVVTDPPYALVSIVKRFGKEGAAPAKGNDAYRRASAGFMGKSWDTGEVAFDPEFWADVLRAMKPGAHLVAFSGTRSYHRLACAIEDAGFEIRDQLAWVYGSGFPKSHDVSKAIDKKLGAERTEIIAERKGVSKSFNVGAEEVIKSRDPIMAPATAAAAAWQGWGTALKPAWEPIVLARKPLAGTVAETVLMHGTGALNIDGCRVQGGPPVDVSVASRRKADSAEGWTRPWMDDQDEVSRRQAAAVERANEMGRWPANIVHDGSAEVVAHFPDAGAGGPASGPSLRNGNSSVARGQFNGLPDGINPAFHADSGSAARFFYTAKADGDDRLGSKHPTVKPVDLMQWLVRLVCPKGGTVLDPFAGTGTTGEAAWREGCRAILFEREAEYREDIARRMELGLAPVRLRKAAARRAPAIEIDEGGLFGTAVGG